MTDVKPKLRNHEVLIIIFLTLIGFSIRLALLPDRFFTYDEAWTLSLAKASIEELIKGSISALNSPLYFLFLHFWLRISQDPFILRLSSALFGALLIPLSWYVGKKLFNSKVGIISSYLVAFSPAFIFESANLRMYSLGILEGLLIIYFFWQFLRERKISFLSALGLTLLLAIYTHQFFFLAVLSLNLFFFLNRQQYKNLLRKWYIVQLIILLFCLPIIWLTFTLPPIKLLPFTFSFWKTPSLIIVFAFSWDALQILKLFPFKFSNFLNLPVILISLSFFFVFLSGVKEFRGNKAMRNFLLIYLALPMILIFLASLIRPVFGVRSFILFSPAYYFLIAYSFSKFKERSLILTLLILFLTESLFLVSEYRGFRTTQVLREPYNFVKTHSLPQDLFIHSDPYTLVLARSYLNDSQFALFPSWFSSTTESALGYKLITPTTRFWYFVSDFQYYNRNSAFEKQKEFENKYQLIMSKNFEEAKTRVTLFNIKN